MPLTLSHPYICKKYMLELFVNIYVGVYNINVQTGPSLGVMHLHVIALTLTPASSYINIVHLHCTLRNPIFMYAEYRYKKTL
jgi:hypothetical protein